MLLRDWMHEEGLDDAAVAARIGDISPFMVRKLRFRDRGPSIRVAARIGVISGGKVGPADLQRRPRAKVPAIEPLPEAVP